LIVTVVVSTGAWLFPAEAAAATPRPAAPTNLQLTTYREDGSSVVQYRWYDHAYNETQFWIDENEGGYPVGRSVAAHPGTGWVNGWFFFYPGSTPITVCARVRAYNWGDNGIQYSGYSNQACSTLR